MKQFLTLFSLFISIAAFCQQGETHYKKAEELHRKSENITALIEVNKALGFDSIKISYLSLKADILQEMKNYQEAYSVYTKVLSIDQTDIKTYNNLGVLLQTVQQFDDAIENYTTGLKFVKHDSDRNMLLLNMAVSKIYKRDFNGAYANLMTIYKSDSSDMGMLINLASICDEIGRGDETLIYLKRAISIDPNNIAAIGNIGFKYQEMGDHKTAIQYFDRVIILDPGQALGYSNRSFNKLKLGDSKGAMEDIQRSIELYPENSYAYRIRALIYIKDKKSDLACKDLDKALELNFTSIYGDEVEKLKAKNCKK